MPALPAINNLRTTLTTDLGIADASVHVVSTAGWPSSGILSVGNEVIVYASKTVNAFTGLTRGFDGTTTAIHALGSNVSLRIVAKHLNDAAFIKNAPTPISVGGIPAGTVFPERLSVQEMMELLLYPYQAPAFASISLAGHTPPFEVGYTVPAAVTFNWATTNPTNVQANSLSITDVSAGNTLLAAGLADDGSHALLLPSAILKTVASTYQFRMGGVNSKLEAFTGLLTLSWLWRLHYGVQANPLLTGVQVGALPSSLLASSYARTYNTGGGGYKFICQAHAAGGQINTVRDQLTGFNVPMAGPADGYANVDGGGFYYALVSVTNAFGITTQYRVYRTKNFLGGAVNLVVT